MATPANITPTAPTDGVMYASAVPLTFTEATLGDGLLTPTIIPVEYGQAIVALVQLTISGIIVGQNSYVVMQMDFGDGNWIDVAWAVWTGSQGSAVFVLSGGGHGAENNSFQQTRQVGQFPASNGSNTVPIAGRIRFVGKATAVGGSSSLSGVPAAVKAMIMYKLLVPR